MSSVKTPTEAAREKAEQRFRVTEQRRSDAEKVMADLAVAKDAEREKTVRLRALRMAKEDADRTAQAAVVKPRARRAKKAE